MSKAKKDLKEGLSSARKADITHMRTPLLVYGARACEYGDDKYERGNYARPMATTKEDFTRLRAYLRAAVSHVMATLDSMEYHQATDPDLEDIEGMKIAAYAEDTDAKPGQAVGASRLPHLCGAVASMNMAITQATNSGLLPKDPGCPWREEKKLDVLPLEGELRYVAAFGDASAISEVKDFDDDVYGNNSATTEEEAIAILEKRGMWPPPSGTS